MTCSTPTLAPDTHPVPGAGADAEIAPLEYLLGELSPTVRAALDRGARADYAAWLTHVRAAGGCAHPVRLEGQLYAVDTATGELLPHAHTGEMPDKVLYKPCGNRRAAACPSCAEIYRADTYHLVLAGLRGGKGVPGGVRAHPCAFATVTAPSFGLVHSTRVKDGRPRACRPRRAPEYCPHGIDLTCHRVHHDGERILGTPLCLDCYDHDHQVVWNCFAGELWRRTMETARTRLAAAARRAGVDAWLSYAKCAEMQARGVAHFHALARLDGHDPDGDSDAVLPAPEGVGFAEIRDALAHAVRSTRFRTPPHPDNPDGWLIGWGRQVDVRRVRARVHADGKLTETAVAGYLAKYATKATETTGHLSARLTADTIGLHADPEGGHTARLLDACWRLGRPGADLDPGQATRNGGRDSYTRLRRWAHMLGFGGHFSTKSRRYSTTLHALREARVTWRREQHRTADHLDESTEDTTLVVGALTYAGIGWHTTGDALLANTAAAKAREHRRVAREELTHLITGHY
ncbi:MAG TPA: replication initiator [Mycobacteriales bacterium]|nr:replication initiator [Mycobacteriales bacterium]